jgi:hypothetical protein
VTEYKEYVEWCIQNKLVHEIHTSERRSFRACRRRWDWLFRQNYYPITTAKPLEFGVAYHEAMEVFYNPDTWDMDREVVGSLAIQKFVDTCEKQRKAALAATGMNYLDPDIQEDYDERVELGRGMLKYFFEQVHPKVDMHWKPVKVEIAFMVPIPNPETGEAFIWCTCDTCHEKWLKHPDHGVSGYLWVGLPVVYAGRIDALGEDANGDYWIIDWKTARSLSTDHDEFLYLDDQIGSYVMALKMLGINVRGFIYHEQKKGFPKAPPKNKQARLGRMFSVAKNQDTDYETYKATVEAEDQQAYAAGVYDEFLEWLKAEGPQFFKRTQIHKSDEELVSTRYNIGLEALDMIDPGLRIYPSAGRFGCNFCAFRQPCLEKNAAGDYQYALDTMFERRQHYYIRNEPSTESKGGE